MKIESPGFTTADVLEFLEQTRAHEFGALVHRLARAEQRLDELVTSIQPGELRDGGEWRPYEILLHIAVLSKFWGLVTYLVGTGKWSELDLVASVRERDPAAERLIGHSPSELLELIRSEHRRTIDYLRTASLDHLRRRCRLGDELSLSAEEFARFALVNHLELHVEQLQAALESGSRRSSVTPE